jgi:hypothetical protein
MFRLEFFADDGTSSAAVSRGSLYATRYADAEPRRIQPHSLTRSLAPSPGSPLAPRRQRRPRRGRPRRAPPAPRNSSPSQYCPPRSVNVHLISAIHILYQPRKAQARTYILIISINTIIRLSTINTIITNKHNNQNN